MVFKVIILISQSYIKRSDQTYFNIFKDYHYQAKSQCLRMEYC